MEWKKEEVDQGAIVRVRYGLNEDGRKIGIHVQSVKKAATDMLQRQFCSPLHSTKLRTNVYSRYIHACSRRVHTISWDLRTKRMDGRTECGNTQSHSYDKERRLVRSNEVTTRAKTPEYDKARFITRDAAKEASKIRRLEMNVLHEFKRDNTSSRYRDWQRQGRTQSNEAKGRKTLPTLNPATGKTNDCERVWHSLKNKVIF